ARLSGIEQTKTSHQERSHLRSRHEVVGTVGCCTATGSHPSQRHLIDKGIEEIVGRHVGESLGRGRWRTEHSKSADYERRHLASRDVVIGTVVAASAADRYSKRSKSIDKRIEDII